MEKQNKAREEHYRKYREINKIKIQAQKRKYYEEHKEEIKSKKAKYDIQNKERQKEYQQQYKTRHQTEQQQYRQQYRATHKAELQQHRQQYRATHKAELQQHRQQYRATHKAELQQHRQQYRATHKAQQQQYHQQYRATHKAEQQQYQQQYKATHHTEHQKYQQQYKTTHKKCIQRQQAQYYKSKRINFKEKNTQYWKDQHEQIRQSRQLNRISRHKRMNFMIRKENAHEQRLVQRLLSTVVNKRTPKVHQILKKLQIQKLIRTGLAIKKAAYKSFEKSCLLFQERIREMTREEIPSNTIIGEDRFLGIVGGNRHHTSHTEPYFREAAYNILPENITIIVGERGVVHNVDPEPISENSKGVKWPCSATCVVRESSVQIVIEFFHRLSKAETKTFLEIFDSVDECGNNPVNSNIFAGHSQICIDNQNCSSSLRCLRELSCHFSAVRSMVRKIYNLKAMAQGIKKLETALNHQEICDIIKALKILKHLLHRESVLAQNSEELNRQASSINPVINEEELLRVFGKKHRPLSQGHKRLSRYTLLLLRASFPENGPEQNFFNCRQTNIRRVCLAPDKSILPFKIRVVRARNV